MTGYNQFFSVSIQRMFVSFFIFKKGERKLTFKVKQKIKDISVTFGSTLHISGWYMSLIEMT